MDRNLGTYYFLGANSSKGFYSLYDDFVSSAKGDFLWAVKGGPGCGKSSFMRKIASAAEAAGLQVEYILCSGDPKSLDGIYIPARRTAYVDATSPHVMEPDFPAASSMYLDLGVFYNSEGIKGYLPELMANSKQYKAMYARAYGIIAAAQAVAPWRIPGLVGEDDLDAVLRRAGSIILRELGKKRPGQGKEKKRFISAFTCDGDIFCEETVAKLCARVYTLDNEYGLAHVFLDEVRRAASDRMLSAVICPSPINPDKLEAVLIPELSLGFLASDSRNGFSGKVYRHVRLDALIDRQRLKVNRIEIRRAARRYKELMEDAGNILADAKVMHDDLERIYNPHVDFDGVYELCSKHIAGLEFI